jgi:hypothetical protein
VDNDPSLTSDNLHVRVNDDAAEKRRWRKSTKVYPEGSLEQETAGESSKSGRLKQLNSLAAPEIKVSLDIMSSNFEEWMKLTTDNVHFEAHFLFLFLIVLIENQCSELVEFCTYRLFSRHVSVEE